ncbi:MAG: M16 family metallopeptidase [Candidatus Dormibacteria bacterium]
MSQEVSGADPVTAESPELITYFLGNGLEVVLSPERSSPTIGVGVFYRAGFRLEPEGRTGFAHLFEHLMFQGTDRVPKPHFGNLINSAGGLLNGFTRHDYTAYFEVLPASALEMACFLEGDRMRSLDINEETLRNQVDVVKEEVRVNVLNQPYGGFSWLWLSQYAYSTYPNCHNYYGEFADLEAATVEDARDFYRTWYGPGNATLVLVGDFDEAGARQFVERHLGQVAAREEPPSPDLDEPFPNSRREFHRQDQLAPTPQLAVGYPTAPFGHPDHLPLALAARILTDGRSSRLQRSLVQGRQLLLHVAGGPHYPIGDSMEFRGPALFTIEATPRPGVTTDAALAALDQELARFAEDGPTAEEVQRARRRQLSSYHASNDSRLGRLQSLGVMAAIHRRPQLVDELPQLYLQVEPEDVRRAVRNWLALERSTVLHWEPGAKKVRS